MNNFQRVDSISNSHVGADFEELVRLYWLAQGILLLKNHSVPIGHDGRIKKSRKFDLGSDQPPILVECKSHKWTITGNMPSAKITVWNESMYYFSLAPQKYRKLFCVLRDNRIGKIESLAAYYIRCYSHLIPANVEIWEFEQTAISVERLI